MNVWLLWTGESSPTLLGVYSAEHWARMEAERLWRDLRPSKARNLMWRIDPFGMGSLGIQPATVRRPAARSEAATPPRLRYRITREEVRP